MNSADLNRAGLNSAAVNEALVDSIDAALPQTQCAQCGHAGCKPYATALAAGQADINQCAPGGDAGIRTLAGLLGREYKPLNPAYGREKPRQVAVVLEELCIGCTLCIQACPVDAIIGAARQMHTVVAAWCTGCDLCVAPCPVDCIEMRPATGPLAGWSAGQAAAARARFEDRNARLARAASSGRPPGNHDAGRDVASDPTDLAAAVIPAVTQMNTQSTTQATTQATTQPTTQATTQSATQSAKQAAIAAAITAAIARASAKRAAYALAGSGDTKGRA